VTATADRFGPGRSREELRLVQVASGLLMQLDAHRLTGRLPLQVQVQASRLRHAVKLAIQAEAARTAALPPAPPPVASQDPATALRAWIAAQPWGQPGPVGWVYLLCFRDPTTGQHAPLRGKGCRGQYAGHYWGWTDDLIRRIAEHRDPRWRGAGRLVQVARAAGLTFELAWLEYPATLGRERRLKNQGSAYRRCPLCRGTGGPLDAAAAVAAVQRSPLPQPRSARGR
jgi:predicted GIY-YIG superfamily endonuclease